MNKPANFHQRLLNQSHVTFVDGDTSSVTYSNTVATPLFGPKLDVQKLATPKNAGLDETITYSVIIRNDGNRAAEVTLYDILPKETSFVKNSLLIDGIPQPGASPRCGIPLGVMKPESVIRVSFQVLVVSLPSNLKVMNQSRVDYVFSTVDGRRIHGSVGSNIEEVNILGQQFSAYLKANTVNTFLGDVILYTVTVTNRGNRRMEHTVISTEIPKQAQFVLGSVTIDELITPSANPEQGIDIGTIEPGQTIQLTFQVRIVSIPPSLELNLQALVTCEITGTPFEQRTNVVQVTLISPQVNLRKSSSRTSTTRGDTFLYELQIENKNSFAVDGILYDVLPAGALYVWDSLSINGKEIKGVHPTQGINLGTILGHTTVTVSFAVSVPTMLTDTSQMSWRNQARLSYTYRMRDGRSVREVIYSNTVIVGLYAPIISLSVQAQPQLVESGDQVTFNLELCNHGNIEAEVVLTNLIPLGTALVANSAVVNGTSKSTGQSANAIFIGHVSPHQCVSISFLVQVDEKIQFSVIRDYVLANYTYTLNDKLYRDEVRSNEYELWIDDPYE